MAADSARVRAVFLDRDGTLMEEVGHCGKPDLVEVFPGVPEALLKLRDAGFLLCLITNQGGIGQGFFTEEDFHAVQAELFRQLHPARIDAVYYCPDPPHLASPRRKPGAGMLLEAAQELGIDLAQSYIVGDRDSDILCGRSAGLHTVLVETGYGRQTESCPEFRVPSLVHAAELIVERNSEVRMKKSERRATDRGSEFRGAPAAPSEF